MDQMQNLSSMTNPNAMMGMMKNQISMMASTMIQFYWVSYFFSGFILAKVPFPVTQKFRDMLQQGVDIRNLDVRYISSLSLYFLIMFGLGGLQSLILGQDVDESSLQEIGAMNQQMQQMQMMQPQQPGQIQDLKKLFQQEKESLVLVNHEYALENQDEILLQKWRQKHQKNID